MAQKILLVEDDPCFGSVLKSYLELSDYEVTLCVNGNDGLEAFRKDKFDICLLDVMMPEMDGFTLGKKIREIDGNVPFVYITAKSMKEDMKQGYEIGADDYIVKPFEVLELLVRVEKVLERTGKQRETLEFADIRIVLGEHQVYKAGQEISLKPLEYDLLVLLAKNKNRAFTRDQLLNQVWGNDYLGESRTVDVHIGQLRKKLGLADVIKTIPKIGYRLED